jgi:hypothetical protein
MRAFASAYRAKIACECIHKRTIWHPGKEERNDGDGWQQGLDAGVGWSLRLGCPLRLRGGVELRPTASMRAVPNLPGVMGV